ncbi:MAG: trypsin-like peptidase domain-containing protein, partial [Candidatus Paceibacterota bacterium]
SDGYIVTNKHVVDDSSAGYEVKTKDGKTYEAKIIAKDPLMDIAFIKIEGKNFPFLEIGDSGNLKLGQTVIAIGNALAELSNTVSVGVVSGLSRSVVAGDNMSGKEEQLDEVIQTDAAINPGNSGGPLLDLDGKVVGVNVAMASGSENIAFSLPTSIIKGVLDSVRKNGKISRPFLGIRYMAVTPALKDKNKLSVDYGMLIVRGQSPDELAVMPGSAADKAGIVENDIILEIDGVKLNGESKLSSIIAKKRVGDKIKLKLLHKGETKIVTVTLDEAK